jgi:hypothetical protein
MSEAAIRQVGRANLFWTWVFGFVGALLAIPATLFVKTLLQGRQETHFLVVLLSGQGDSDSTVTIPNDRQEESDIINAKHTAVIVNSTQAHVNEE